MDENVPVPVTFKLPDAKVPVVDRFSLPKLIDPLSSVIEPLAKVRFPIVEPVAAVNTPHDKVDAPLLIFPKPLVILPSFKAPTVVIAEPLTLNWFPFFDNPVPAFIEPAPENWETVKAVEPSVGVPLWVNTKPLLALTFPCSTKTNVPPVNSSLESASGALDNVKVVPSKAPTV